MRVLIIDDHAEMASAMRENLESHFFAVDVAHDGENGLYLARTNPYDLILLDYVMPKLDGKGVCEALRKEGKSTPILMISVKTEVPDKVEVLNLGADDFLTKPFSSDELVARMRALLRRVPELKSDVLRCVDLEMDCQRYHVSRAGKPLTLTRKEFMMLECLLRHQGNVVKRSTLIDHVWDSELDPFSNTMDTHVLNLRKKVEGPGKRKLIHTIPGVGYALHA